MIRELEVTESMTLSNLQRAVDDLVRSYPGILVMARGGDNRQAVFSKEIVDLVLPLLAIVEVHSSHQYIHPTYALEKLNDMKTMIDHHISFYESLGGSSDD